VIVFVQRVRGLKRNLLQFDRWAAFVPLIESRSIFNAHQQLAYELNRRTDPSPQHPKKSEIQN
jgi:hypothetical protein